MSALERLRLVHDYAGLPPIETVRPLGEGICSRSPKADPTEIDSAEVGAPEIGVLQVGPDSHASGVRIEVFIGPPSGEVGNCFTEIGVTKVRFPEPGSTDGGLMPAD